MDKQEEERIRTTLALEIEKVFNSAGLGRPAFAFAFTLPPDFWQGIDYGE